jgi:hypothetical protein
VRGQKIVAAVGFTFLLGACATGRFGPSADTKVVEGPRDLKKLTVAERNALLQRAQVWEPIDTRALNLLTGPSLPANLKVDSHINCRFVFPDKPLTGNTPKFQCAMRPDDVVKVKYGPKNGEVFAEVAASRLLWALGFKADRMYPARVTCSDCPADPFAASKDDWKLGRPGKVAQHVFDPAAVERELPGSSIEVPDFEGWAWPELDKVNPGAGGAAREHVDALKLLAVFLQHSDTKPEQQELMCAPGATTKTESGNETCKVPWLVVKDLGTTFGKATRLNDSKMDLEDWSGAKIWRDGERCIGDLPRSLTGSLENPQISETGRRFLAGRLALLSDAQIRDLFRAAQAERREGTVEDWVRVFKRKRDEIAKAQCA